VTRAIEVSHVHKLYRRYGRRKSFGTLKSALLSGRLLRDLQPDQVLEALKDVSFDVPAGRTFGIIGRNGSGKSTMLKLIAGIGKPTSGTIKVQGKVSALIELGAGFHPEISGRENVFINGMMLGLSKRAIAERFDEIVSFAELEEFIDAPVKTYSSGMYMRLGFAVAINVDPDVLLVDEVLAVGDQSFTNKCLDKFDELRRGGRTILIVTHSLDVVTRFCEEALWLDEGQVRGHGAPQQVIDAYLAAVAQTDHQMHERTPHRLGVVEIIDVQLIGPDRRPTTMFASGDAVEIRVTFSTSAPVQDAGVTFSIFNADGVRCCGASTLQDGLGPAVLDGAGVATCRIERLDLVDGTYSIDVAIHRPDGTMYHEDHRTKFTMTSQRREAGIFQFPRRWSFSGGVRGSRGDQP
jgi:ABC-type polysaccharide/polyol phosphate transport system ATPase subunit